MGKYFCQCLNVCINIKSTDLSKLQSPQPDVTLTDEFFLGNIVEVQLSLEGIHYEYPALIKKQVKGDWLLHKCVCCVNTTHATHNQPGSSKLLLNKQVWCDRSVAETLTQSAGFCPVYRIILPTGNDNQPVRSLGLGSEQYGTLQKVLSGVQHQLNTFLVQEEQAVEDRIKIYMDSQRVVYAELQSTVRRHKNTLINLILASEQCVVTGHLSDAMTDSPISPLSPVHPLSSEEVTGSEAEAAKLPPAQVKRQSAFSSIHEVPMGKAKNFPSLSDRLKMGADNIQHQHVSSSMDPDGDLDFDAAFEDDGNSEPFYISDEETEDTDDSECEGRWGLDGKDTNKNMYSTSVPISVPMWGRSIRKSLAEDVLEEDILPQDAASMAASIKALAQSVHGDGTEMFGELPRPRLNTSNFNL